MNDLIIHIGSTSPHKVNPVKNFCKIYVPGPVVIKDFAVNSGVRDQPYGLRETACGAINRAIAVWSKNIISIGIEGGIIELPVSDTLWDIGYTTEVERVYLCVAVVAVMDRNGKIYMSTSSGMQFPSSAVMAAQKQDITIGKILANEYGGDHTDPREILSFGRVHRRDSIEDAVKLALFNIF